MALTGWLLNAGPADADVIYLTGLTDLTAVAGVLPAARPMAVVSLEVRAISDLQRASSPHRASADSRMLPGDLYRALVNFV